MGDEKTNRGPPDEVFEPFVASVEAGLRRALVAGYGPEVGRDAALDALVWAWRNWPRVEHMENPGGYLYRVGQSAARRQLRRDKRWRSAPSGPPSTESVGHGFEPGLDGALAALSPRQRAAVVLVHGHGYSLAEASGFMGCSTSTVRNHADRALARLRPALGGSDGS